MAKKEYYNISNMLATKADYMILLGQRANGKSYQAKLTCLKHYLQTGEKFVYVRRWRSDITRNNVSMYFADMPIPQMTGGKYEGVTAFGGMLYFYRIEDSKQIKGEQIGAYISLNESERIKSLQFVNYRYILFEEFITDKMYLTNEPTILQHVVSTIARDNNMTVLMIGNTLSRVCPYFAEWCLDGVLKQKLGTIEMYHFHTDNGITNIAVEMCGTVKTSSTMFFGQASKQIITGEWDTVDMPKLPKPAEEYVELYEVLFKYQKFAFVVKLLADESNGGTFVYIYPHTGKREIDRVVTNVFSTDPNVSARLLVDKRPEAMMATCFLNGNVCFSDNLTGVDFRNVNQVFRLGYMYN